MEYKDFIKRNSSVIWHGEFWDKESYKRTGCGWVKKWKRAKIVSTPRDTETGKFTNDFYYDDSITVNLKDRDGNVFESTLDKLEPDVDPSTLSEEELTKLWNEISHGSIYYSDYRNSLGVFQEVAYDFFEGYAEENWYDLKEEFPKLSADQ